MEARAHSTVPMPEMEWQGKESPPSAAGAQSGKLYGSASTCVPTHQRHIGYMPGSRRAHAPPTPAQPAGRCARSYPAGPEACTGWPDCLRRNRGVRRSPRSAIATAESRSLLQAAVTERQRETAGHAADRSPTPPVALSAAARRALPRAVAWPPNTTPGQTSFRLPRLPHAFPRCSTRSRRHRCSKRYSEVTAITSFPSCRGICLKIARCTYSTSAIPSRVPVRFDVSMYPYPGGIFTVTGSTLGCPSSVCQSADVRVVARNMASAYWVVPSAPNAPFENTGELSTRGTCFAASRVHGLFEADRAGNSSLTGTSTVGITVVPPCDGSRPGSVTRRWFAS